MEFLSLAINWLLQICSAVIPSPPLLAFKLFILIVILVLSGVEHGLVSLVTKSVTHPHEVRIC